MGKAMVLIGTPTTPPAPTSPTAETAALEYFVNRRISGNWAPRPPVERWSGNQRERFEHDPARLERESL